MSANVETVNGKVSMAYAGDVPWHKTGFEVSNDLTPEQMMIASGTNWEVHKQPAVTLIGDKYVDTGKSALVRTSDNKILDVISNDWKPTQNATAFEFFKEYVEAGQMQMETAGSLDGGRNVWALAKIGESFRILKDDVTEGYLLFSNPHRYGRAITVKFTTVRVVCMNTLTWALEASKGAGSVSVNHSKTFNAESVKQTLGIAHNQLNKVQEASLFLTTKGFTEETLRDFIKQVFPTTSDSKVLSRPAETVLELMDSQPGAEFGKGTWYQALNAVTYAVDHKLGRSEDTRLQSAWFGINENRKVMALRKAMEFAKVA